MRPGPSVLATALSVAARELRSALRDRQTLVYAVVLPLALYPVLFWVLLQGLTVVRGREERTLVRVGVAGIEAPAAPFQAPAELAEWLSGAPGGPLAAHVLEPTARDPAALVASEDVDAVVTLRERRAPIAVEGAVEGAGEGAGGGLVLELAYDGSRPRSDLARRRIAVRMDERVELLRAAAVGDAGLDPESLRAFELETLELSSDAGRGGFLLSYMLPMMLVLMAVLGAFIPAVDATAGEKERGTLETSLLAPAPRLGVHLGVLLAVSATSLAATLLNLTGMAVAAKHLFSMLPGSGGAAIEIPVGTLFALLPFLLLFVLFASAVLSAVASTADTFKQGQAMLGSVQLVFLVPAIVAVLPGVQLTPGLALVPVLQVVLAMKTVLQQAAENPLPWGTLLLAGLSTAVYTGLAVVLAVRVLARQSLDPGGRPGLRRLVRLALGRTSSTNSAQSELLRTTS